MIFPLRATMTTTPGNLPSAISFFNIEVIRPRRSSDIPTCSGVAVARGWSSRAQTGSDIVVATTIAANAVDAANIFHLDMTFLRDRSCEDRVRSIRQRSYPNIVVLGHAFRISESVIAFSSEKYQKRTWKP